jgi:hypothetical protein
LASVWGPSRPFDIIATKVPRTSRGSLQQQITGDQCPFELSAAHSYGGEYQGNVDSVQCGEQVKSPSGKMIVNNSDDLQSGHKPILFKAGDWKGAADVTMTVGYDRASNHLTTCKYEFQGKTQGGTVKDDIQEGTVTITIPKCTFSLPCNA